MKAAGFYFVSSHPNLIDVEILGIWNLYISILKGETLKKNQTLKSEFFLMHFFLIKIAYVGGGAWNI